MLARGNPLGLGFTMYLCSQRRSKRAEKSLEVFYTFLLEASSRLGAQHTLLGAQHTLLGAQYTLLGAQYTLLGAQHTPSGAQHIFGFE